MRHTTILTVTNDVGWLAELRPALHSAGRGRLVVARSVEEAARLVGVATPRLIVIRDGESGPTREQLAALLWANSILEHPAAVAVVAEGYDADRATSLYQLGVDEYLSIAEHADRAEEILLELSRSRPAPRAYVGVPISSPRPSRVQPPAGAASDRVAVA